MRRWQFFLPRRFVGTNEMLKMQRAAGHYVGARGALPKRGFGFDKYACEASSIREDAAYMTRAYVRIGDSPPVKLFFDFWFVGHEHLDCDAGLLPAKYLVDGICGALGFKSDRSVIRGVELQNCIIDADSREAWEEHVGFLAITGRVETHPYGPGVIVCLTEVQ